MIRPTGIRLKQDDVLELSWSDEATHAIPIELLRKSCPCATCREKRIAEHDERSVGSLPVLSLAETKPLRIEAMQPVGNYAYTIKFSDGHDTGIFTIEFLRKLGEAIDGASEDSVDES